MAKIFTIAESVKELKALLAAGKAPDVGKVALSMNGMDWRCIDQREDGSVVLMMAAAYDWRPFARPDKAHPWGWNNYMASQIRKELNGEVLEDLFGDERELIEDWQGMGRLFLLSEEEVGFKQTEDTFAWFQSEDRDLLEERRQMKDRDGDKTFWWLRSPYPSIAGTVRFVYSDGSLNHSYAYGGNSAVAACVFK